MIMGEPQRIPRNRTVARPSPAHTASLPTRTDRHAGPPNVRYARSARARDTRASLVFSPVVRELGANLGQRRRQGKSAKHGAPSREITMFPGVMSPCITPRLIPTTSNQFTASPISSLTASGFATPARLRPATSSITIDPGDRGASTSCATPTTPRSRSSVATSCPSRRSASGPSGSFRITARPEKNSRVTRVRSLSWTISVEQADLRPAALLFPSDTFTPLPTQWSRSRRVVA